VSGRYQMFFTGNWTAITAVHGVVSTILGRTFKIKGYSITPVLSTPVKYTNDMGLLMIESELEGFPWALLLTVLGVIGGGLFAWLSLTEVRRVVVSGPMGSSLMMLGVVAVAALGGLFLIKKKVL
jgi:hypothetical protein